MNQSEQLKLRGLYLTIDKRAWFAVSPEKTIVPKSCQEEKTFLTRMLYSGLQIEQLELIWNSKTTFWLLKIALYYWQCCFMKLSYMDEKQELRIRKNVQLKVFFFIKTVSIVTNHISVQQTCTNQLPLRHVKLMKTKQRREWNLNFHFFERTFFRIEAVKNSLTMQQSPVLSQYFSQKVVVMFIARPYP